MCQGCEDFKEFDRAVDAYIARELPKMLAPISAESRAILEGRPGV